MNDSLKPYESPEDDAYEYDEYYDAPRRGGGILWGRVALLALGLLIAFLLGRATAGGGSDEELTRARADLKEAEAENADLQDQLAAARQDAAEAEETPDTDPTDDAAAADDTDNEDEVELETYTVEPGDTLREIAQTFCGNPDLDDLIAATNGIDDATQLSVGAELQLPEECAT